MVGFVYLITNTANQKYYVGKTTKPLEQRFREHLNAARCNGRSRNAILQRAIRKYGNGQFVIEPLCCPVDEARLSELEKLWILVLRSNCGGIGYNMNSGGDGFSDPHGIIRKKISAALIGRKVPREVVEKAHAQIRNKPQRKRTAEERMRLSLARRRVRYGPIDGRSTDEKKAATRLQMSESAKLRWARRDNCEGSLASLAKGHLPESREKALQKAREVLNAMPKHKLSEIRSRASQIRWARQRATTATPDPDITG
jgi:group I intron endonuclease